MSVRKQMALMVVFGLILFVMALYVDRRLRPPDTGWFAYAPNTSSVFESHADSYTVARALVWLNASAVWGLTGLVLLRKRKGG